MKRLNVIFLLFCLSAPLAAQAVTAPSTPMQPLTQEAAVEFALAHNPAFMAAFTDVSASREKVNQAKAGFLPKVNGSYMYERWSQQPYVSIVGIPEFQNVPFALQNENLWDVEVVQPLFTGFELVSNYNASKAGLKVSKYNLQKARLDLTRDVRVAYLQTLLAQKLVRVASDNVRSLQVQKKNAEANYQQGVAARNDVLKADVALAEAVQTQRKTKKQLIVLRATLNQYLGIELDKKIALSGIKEKNATVPAIDRLYEIAQAQRPEFLSLKESIKQAEYYRKAAEGEYYPHVSAFADYFREGQDFAGSNNPYGNSNNTAVGLKVNWNFFEGGNTRASVLEWDYRLKGLHERQTDLLEKIDLQVKDALKQLEVAKADIATSRTALKQAEENERITTLQYKEQVAIFLDVLNSEVFLVESRARYYQSVYGYEIAKAQLERAIGVAIEQ